jgi:vacuole morphology and inheritance protein 14
MFPNGDGFIDNFDKLLPNDDEKLLEQMIYFFCDVANYNESYLNDIIDKIINQLLNDKKLRDLYWEKIMKLLSDKIDIVKIYQKFSEILLLINNVKFINEMVNKLNIFLISNNSGKELRSTLSKYGRDKDKNAKAFFDQLYTIWSYSPIAVLILTLFSEYYELSFNLILNFTGIKLENEFYKELGLMVQLLETSSFNPIRIKFLEPMKNLYLVRSIYGILMLLPQGNAFDALSKRMEGISTLYDYDQYKEENSDNEIVNEDINYYIKIFNDTQKLLKI